MHLLRFHAPFWVSSGQRVRFLSFAIATSLAVSLSGCSSNPKLSDSPEKLQIITTFVPITNFTKAVAGDRAEVAQLLPNNISPHDYQAKPEDVQKLAKAKILVENGLGMETFLTDLIKNAGNNNLKIIDSSQGIATISNQGSKEQGHDKEHRHEAEHDQGKEGEKAEKNHDHGELNAHIWLDPKRAIQQVENIRDGLIAADPAGKEAYTANAAAYVEKLKQLDAEFSQKLKHYAGKTFVTYHDFASYFAQSYNLKAEFLVGIPEENASPEDVKRVMNAVKQSNLKTLLTEPQAADSPFTALAKDLNVRVSTFDSLESSGAEGLEPDYYLKTLRQNVKNLETAFSGNSTQSWLLIRINNRSLATISQPLGSRF